MLARPDNGESLAGEYALLDHDISRPVGTDPESSLTGGRWQGRLAPAAVSASLYIIAWLDRVNISIAAVQMNADLGFTKTVYGFGAGVFS